MNRKPFNDETSHPDGQVVKLLQGMQEQLESEVGTVVVDTFWCSTWDTETVDEMLFHSESPWCLFQCGKFGVKQQFFDICFPEIYDIPAIQVSTDRCGARSLRTLSEVFWKMP